MLEWLLAPIDPARVHDVGWHLSWHARLMVVAWGGLVPLGILIARFFKIVPWQKWPERLDNHLWWNAHRICQYSACVFMIVGMWLIRSSPPLAINAGPHTYLGWAALAIAAMQIIGGILRGSKGGPTAPAKDGTLHGDHFDMTPRRLAFEYAHKLGGYIALLFACGAIMSGLWQANAANWMWLTISLWWVLLIIAAITFQRRGMAVDTYQAIWGPDPELPGNKRRPVGVGTIKRQ